MPAESRETRVRKAAEAQGWRLEKDGKLYRLVDANGTVLAADWTTGDGLPLEQIEAASAVPVRRSR